MQSDDDLNAHTSRPLFDGGGVTDLSNGSSVSLFFFFFWVVIVKTHMRIELANQAPRLAVRLDLVLEVQGRVAQPPGEIHCLFGCLLLPKPSERSEGSECVKRPKVPIPFKSPVYFLSQVMNRSARSHDHFGNPESDQWQPKRSVECRRKCTISRFRS